MTVSYIEPVGMTLSPRAFEQATRMLREAVEVIDRVGIPNEWTATLSIRESLHRFGSFGSFTLQLTIGWKSFAWGQQVDAPMLFAMSKAQRADFLVSVAEHACHRVLTGVMRQERENGATMVESP